VRRIREAHFVHDGPSRFVGRTGSGRQITFGDLAPAGELSPVEMVVASLATCSAMDVASIASKKRQAVERYEVHVVGDQRDEYPQVLTEATVTHEFWGADLSEAALRRAIELSATKYCPVNAMVSAGATIVHHRYSIHSAGAEPYEREGEVLATGPYRRADVLP
jgi:putative redox protein